MTMQKHSRNRSFHGILHLAQFRNEHIGLFVHVADVIAAVRVGLRRLNFGIYWDNSNARHA